MATTLDKSTPILIVGAGIAGISALSKLLENGYNNVTLLEASNRIGGRIHTVPFASNVVDLGAQWVHGEDGNIIYDTVKDLNLLDVTKEPIFNAWIINSEGELSNDYNELYRLARKISDKASEYHQKSNISFADYFIEQLDEFFFKFYYPTLNIHSISDTEKNWNHLNFNTFRLITRMIF